MTPDPYKILGVSSDASLQEIKQTFRKKAKILHPDLNDSPDAQEKFLIVYKAYKLLLSETFRNDYDKKYGKKVAKEKEEPDSPFNSNWARYSQKMEAEEEESIPPYSAIKEYVPPKWIKVALYLTGIWFSVGVCYYTIKNVYDDIWPMWMLALLLIAISVFYDSINGLTNNKARIIPGFVKSIKQLFSFS